MTAQNHLAGLNPQQRMAVEHGIGDSEGTAGGPLLIIAGAGSGKTNTLAHRVAHLLLNGADPHRILLLTFSRRAAAEMTSRVERIAAGALGTWGRAAPGAIAWSGTFHAIGARLLRAHAVEIGISPSFTILDREDAADLLDLARHDLGLSMRKTRFPLKRTCLAIYSHAVNAEAPLDAVLARAFPWCGEWEAELKALFAAYVDAKQRQQVLDYDDLLLYWARMMAVPALAAAVAERFDHVLVDEYQDTNRLQASILQALKPRGDGLTVVGDDAQAIYSFRAATVRNILDFPGQFAPPARIVTLEQNYRSTPAVLAACNAVIGLAAESFTKTLRSSRATGEKPRLVMVRDDRDQVAYVIDRILERREAGVALKAQAVLFRTSHHSAALEIELGRRNIPFVKYGGLKFLEAAHVKDVIGVLRWAANPHDQVAGFRVLRLLPGIGAAGARKVAGEAAAGGSLAAALAAFRPPAAAKADWPSFATLIGRLASRAFGWPEEIAAIRQWYEPQLERLYDDPPMRLNDLLQLEQIAAASPTRDDFLTDLALDPPAATSDEAGAPLLDEDYLILSTIHSAKGQEWKSVYLLNVVDGCLPSDMATGTADEIEEERRLLYVAMTRARDQLHLVVPQRFYTHQQPRRGDRHVYAARSRFIPPALLDRFECLGWSPRRGQPDAAAATGRTPVDLKATLREMWR
jgi:DNA helicase II / ATP-dependent DNA helicase PcrA